MPAKVKLLSPSGLTTACQDRIRTTFQTRKVVSELPTQPDRPV